MKNHKQCLELVDLYRSYTCRDDGHKKHHGDFRIWDKDNIEVVFEEKNEEDGDVRFFFRDYSPWWKLDSWNFLSEVDNPLQWLKRLEVVQVIPVVRRGKVVPVKDLMICGCGEIMAPFSYLRDSEFKKALMEKLCT
jgi:hypothetical protein